MNDLFHEGPLRRKRTPTQISLTPLIDVVFILLIFFMLASSFTRWQSFELDLPQAGKSQNAAGNSQAPIRLILLPDERVQVQDKIVTEAALVLELEVLFQNSDKPELFLSSAPGTRVQRVLSVLNRLKANGWDQVHLIRSPVVTEGSHHVAY